MLTFLTQLFTWWNGQTLNTRWHTARNGELVGQDEFGNSYYQTKGARVDPALGYVRRWVIYKGYAEASKVPAEWHGWLHHTFDEPPTAAPQRSFELLQTYVIQTPEFRFTKPVIGFETSAKGELIATDVTHEIRALCDDCTIFMPARMAIVGREGVYLTRPVG